MYITYLVQDNIPTVDKIHQLQSEYGINSNLFPIIRKNMLKKT